MDELERVEAWWEREEWREADLAMRAEPSLVATQALHIRSRHAHRRRPNSSTTSLTHFTRPTLTTEDGLGLGRGTRTGRRP